MVSSSSRAPTTAILTGTTASGKTAIALETADRHGLEIINADSLLVYRGMDIGTAKPTPTELARVRHHLIDVRDPDQPYNAAEFARDVEGALSDIAVRGRRALIVGGTGFYLKALVYGVWEAPGTSPELRARLESEPAGALHARLAERDPASALRIGAGDRYRLVRALEVIELSGRTPSELEAVQAARPADPRFRLLVTDRETGELAQRIDARTRQMLEQGLVDEVRSLRARYPAARALEAVGYAETIAHLDGVAPAGRQLAPGLEGLASEIALATRQLVKRQRTWFKGQFADQLPDGPFVLNRDLARLEQALEKIYVP